MLLKLYDQWGNEKAELQANDSSTQDKEVQTDNVLSLGFTLYEHVSIDVNDYVDYLGERYWATEKYEPAEKSSVEWEYSLKLYGIESLIKRFLVLNNTDGENEAVFTLTARPVDHVRLIVKCINDGMGRTDFKVGIVEGADNVIINYEGKYCDEALKELAEAVGVEWWFDGETLNLSRCEWGSAVVLGYGEGLTGLEEDRADNVKFYTRLFPIGSSRNIDRERYGSSRLQLPGGAKYVDLADLVEKYGIIHHYEQEAFSGIYPRRVGVVSSVRSEEVEDSDGNPYTIYYFKDEDLAFDPNDYEIGGLVKHVSFQEGSELAGLGTDKDHYFEVNYDSGTREFEIITIWPYDDGRQLPGDTLVPKPGDKYILWNIRMPDEYYTLAETEYLTAVEAYNRKHVQDVSCYKAPTDHVWIEETGTELAVGRRVRLKSTEYFPGLGYRESRITRISRSVNLPSQMDLEISDALSSGTLEKIGDAISDAKSYAGSILGGVNVPDVIKSWETTKPTDTNLYSARRTHMEFLSKKKPDTAKGKITFQQGFDSQAPSTTSGLENTGDLTNTGNVIVGKDSPTHDDNPVSKSKNFNSGTAGWYLDNFGNMELESLTVRSFLEVTELLINRLQAQEGDTIFTDNDQITDVQRVVEHEGTQNETVSYILTLKEKWEGYFTAQQEGNIVKGIINTLAAEQANVWDETNPDHSIADYGLVWKAADPNKMPQNPSQFEYYERSGSAEPYTYTRTTDTTVVEGKTYWRKIQDTDAGGNKYYTSWMRIVEDRNTQGTTLGNNQIRVVLYGDQEVPSQKNFPPCVSMTIGRWGCAQDPDESGITDGERLSREQRQRLFYISVSDGKIMKLTGVDKPILRQYNYGTTLGTLPDFVKDWNIADNIIPGRDYLYAQGIVVGDFLQVDIDGKPRTNYVDCGEWVNGAELDEPTPRNGIYLKDEYNPIGQMVETHDVWHGGMKWRCLQHQPVIEGGVAHYYEPMWNSDYWQFIEGDANFYLELTSSNGLSFRRGAVNTTISAFLYFGNYDFDITNEVGAYYYNWTRHEQGNETLVYTAVSSTTGKNPMREGWFVKSGEQYLPTFDTTPQGGTTYYARSSSITYTPQDEAWNRSHEHMTSFNLTNLDMPQSWSSTNKIVFTCTVTILDGDNRIYVSNRLIS